MCKETEFVTTIYACKRKLCNECDWKYNKLVERSGQVRVDFEEKDYENYSNMNNNELAQHKTWMIPLDVILQYRKNLRRSYSLTALSSIVCTWSGTKKFLIVERKIF